MKNRLYTLFIALVATTALWAQNNVITYTATEKLTETTDENYSGLHMKAFNVTITSHTFSNGVGTITFSGDVTSIGYQAFYGCHSLTSITILNSVTSIGTEAFYNCYNLTSLTIPNSVTKIGYEAFHLCQNLASIVVDNGNTTFDSRNNCNAIIKTATNTLIKGCKNTIIPNSVKTIDDYAFYWCPDLKSINIPSSVTKIGYDAFYRCSGLTSIVVDNGNIYYDSRDNCNAIIETASNTLILGSGTTTIPNSVKTIDDYALYGCRGLKSINIPNSVTSIGYSAFRSCDSLTLVTIGNSVTTIDGFAFENCHSLTFITIGNSVKTIGNWAFDGCNSLTSITIPNSVKTIGNGAFGDCDGLVSITCLATAPPTCGSYCFSGVDKSIPLYVPKSSINAYKNANQWQDFTNIKAIEDRTDFDINNTTITVSELEALVMVPLDARGEITKYSYGLYLDNAHTDLVCSMDFNAAGKMSNPVIRKAPMREQADELQTFDSFTFEISGLEANTTYYYVLKASTNAKTFIKEDSFTTKASAVRDVSSQIKKVCKQNQILLEVNGNTYDIWGNKH